MARFFILLLLGLPCLLMTDTPCRSPVPLVVTEVSFDVRTEKCELISFAIERLLCNRPTKMITSMDANGCLVFWLGYRQSKIEKVTLRNAPLIHGQPTAEQLAALVK